jgi:general secretion pathway protein A
MYEAFFGLHERPFQLTPNPRFLFLNPRHREALATLRYGLSSSLGITLLLGEAGTGKTTLLRAALHAERRPDHRHVVLSNPTLSPVDFYQILAARFGLADAHASKGRFLLAFERDLLERHGAGGLTALVIDEAQSLTHELFEEIRLLANLETSTAKLVNVVLVGQPELAARLNDPSLRQLKQRVVLRCSLEPLDLQSTASYVAGRLRVAGASPLDVFTRDAVVAIYEASRGIPRTIGVVCENALLAGYAAQKKPIDVAIVDDVCRGLDLPANGRPFLEDDMPPDEGAAQPDLGAAQPDQDAAKPDQDTAKPDQKAAVLERAAPEELRSHWGAFRFRFPARNTASRPEPAGKDPDAPRADDRTRIFRFS